ncbi:hypothetical protein [Aurantimonas sp. VKM B-3413]|uniref:DUF6894 family protein n=1 Tax=Aurantimonas sp. VKM B-3413 TaxID=2779401 RepID=UPI001E61E57C|nr:hypothetical protein [Aurantimonas sp. VKM B-3413]MCB8835823.1 hypothetical protein [Aurantimonas sp. VKM B-3413]
MIDDEGYTLPNGKTAKDVAILALTDMVRGEQPESNERRFQVVVRDTQGRRIFCTRLVFEADDSRAS